jgi:hypothetical protein
MPVPATTAIVKPGKGSGFKKRCIASYVMAPIETSNTTGVK